ncbi:hypothetical protein [Vibrio sp. 10N]|uniref:hypothetical protein n=1 Tax=Vibrio sp. 10N TaxID=3058938 RepID=UPI002814960A|nr:hypothetical protein VB10N_12680 [Vibrio sp. 10N]
MDPILEVKGLYKVFGGNSKRAFSFTDIEVEKWNVTKQCVGLARELSSNPAIPFMGGAFSAHYSFNPIEMQNESTCLYLIHLNNDDVLQAGCPDDILHNPTNGYVEAFLKGVHAVSLLFINIIARNINIAIARVIDSSCKQSVSEFCNNNLLFIHLLTTPYGNHYEKLN